MWYRLLARPLALLHVAYTAFVVLGSLAVLRWPSLLWLHVLAIAWAVATMTTDLGCVLTSWEKSLWRKGGLEPYAEGFLQHHVLRMVFPPEHEKRNHVLLGVLVLVLNAFVYGLVIFRR
jgi:hypothetical protein